jgi:putative MATE family efflux protein
MNAYITAQGATKISMISVLIGAACNIALDPIFIYGLGLGVKGAALATVISQMASCAWALMFLFGDKTVLKIRKENLRIELRVVLPCIALGLAPFIMQISESVISVCFNSSLQEYGGDIAVGAMTILTSVMQFAMLPLQGVAQGAQPITSYNYGAKNKERVKKSFFLLLKVSLTYSLLLWASIMIFPSAFASIFTDKPELVEFTAHALRIYCGGLGIFGIQIAAQMTFISLGKAFSSIIVAVVRKFVLLLPLIYIVPNLVADKTMGVYLAEPVADVIAVTFTAILFVFQFRKALKEMDKI